MDVFGENEVGELDSNKDGLDNIVYFPKQKKQGMLKNISTQ